MKPAALTKQTCSRRSPCTRHALGRRSAWIAAIMVLAACSLLLTRGDAAVRILAASAAATPAATRTFQGTLEAKIRELSLPPTAKPKSFAPIVITENEANAYLRSEGAAFLPPAVENPDIRIHADHVTAAADVDFDKLGVLGKQTNDLGAQVLGALFKGRQKVSASGRLQTADGHGQLTIQDLSIGTTNIPDWLTQALVQNYLEKTYKVDLSKPFALPDHVTRIDLASGQATFIRKPSKRPVANMPVHP